MADAAVEFFLGNLSELIVREADLLLTGDTKEKVESIENEIRSIVTKLQDISKYIEILPQIPEYVHECFDNTRKVIRRAEDVIETYAKLAAKRNTVAVYQKPLHWFKVRNQSKELEKIRDEIKNIGQQLMRQISSDVVLRPVESKLSSSSSSIDQHNLGGGGGGGETVLDNTQVLVLRPTESRLSSSSSSIDQNKLDGGGGETVLDNTQVLELNIDHNNTDDIDQMQGHSDALEYKDNDIINPSTLPSHLKQCINHFSLFPPNFEVPARRLRVLWIAEGLVRQNQNETVELVAESYLHELISLDLVKVTKRKLNGKVKACELSDEARDKWLRKPEESKFFKDEEGMTMRLVDHHHHNNNNNGTSTTDSVQNYRNVISFLSFDTQEGRKSGERIGKFVDKCIASDCFLELRILDLERVFRPKLPKSVSKLFRLRYIGLRWTFLEQLPEFVNKLLNLQLLDVKHTYITTLPKSIWSMQFLRHLYLSETYRTRFIDRPLSATSSLTRLQTLWGAFIDETTCVVQGLDTLLDIRKLGLSCRSTSSQPTTRMSEQLKAVDRWISNLEFLESLRLKSKDKNGNPSDLHLSSLTSHGKLSTVYLLGKLQPSVVSEFPLSLTDITLSSSELDADPMSSLEKLPNLVILRLLSKSVVCNRIRSTNKGFPRLKVLKLWMLESLKNWDIEEGAMPCLEELEIRSCVNLEVLPDGLQHVTKLQKLKLTLMPEAFIVKTENTQAKLWAKIVPV